MAGPFRDRATAHRAWDQAWRELATTGGPSSWRSPEPAVIGLLDVLRSRGARTVLDLGTGIGRHAVALAGDGFQVTAVDASHAGIGEAASVAAEAGVHPQFAVCSFLDLPFEAERFDYVLAWNVVYHGDANTVRQAIREISRVLVSGGLYQGTMLSRRHADLAFAQEISAGTFVQPGAGERSHPHFYCDARELLALHLGFEPLHLSDCDHSGSQRSGQWHWEFVFEK